MDRRALLLALSSAALSYKQACAQDGPRELREDEWPTATVQEVKGRWTAREYTLSFNKPSSTNTIHQTHEEGWSPFDGNDGDGAIAAYVWVSRLSCHGSPANDGKQWGVTVTASFSQQSPRALSPVRTTWFPRQFNYARHQDFPVPTSVLDALINGNFPVGSNRGGAWLRSGSAGQKIVLSAIDHSPAQYDAGHISAVVVVYRLWM